MQSNGNERRLIRGKAIPLPGNDIDTDRIIPARYLKCVTFEELGQYAFYDVRFDADGKPTGHPFDDPAYRGHEILLVNSNFGCGSSREHAPQSLMRMGIRAILGESFAEIFAGNCTALGIPVVSVSHDEVSRLMEIVRRDPGTTVELDLERGRVRAGEVEYPLTMPEAARMSLVTGSWDSTAILLANAEEIDRTASRLPYLTAFASGTT